MTTKPFLIDSILGNSRMLVTLTGDGELQRLFWPHIDGAQHVERILMGVAIDDEPVRWQNHPDWQHAQSYETDQNLLVTRSRLADGLTVTATDAATPDRDVLVRHLTFTNEGAAPVSAKFALYQWIRVDENPLYNSVLFHEEADALIHFRKETFLATGADRPMCTYTIGFPEQVLADATAGAFHGGAPLHGDVAGAARWDLGSLAPGESTSLTLYLVMGRSISQAGELLRQARSAGATALLERTRAYWTEWLARAKPLQVAAAEAGERAPYLTGIPAAPSTPAQIEAVYKRSLLIFKLMSDEQTGAVIAAPEFDPGFTACGGYAYCWGRDAAYITTAMDLAGYHELAAGFYRWAVGAQEPEGWWMHRHYTSGAWAPTWGLIQVDETGSILYGMALHARLHGGKTFIYSVWESVARAADWLVGNMDPATGIPLPAVDLWEERTAELTYSAAAVYAGLQAAAEMAAAIDRGQHAERYGKAAAALQAAILRECVRDGRFLRGRFLQVSAEAYERATAAGAAGRVDVGPKGHKIYLLDEDPIADSSLLGMSTPFGVVGAEDPVMVKTVAHLVDSLWTSPAGGMRRYVNDHYRNGNPWILCTLWLGQYEAERGNRERARQLLDWAAGHVNSTGLLAEQVDPVTGEPVWVVPLTWSHAMFVLLALQLYGSGSGEVQA